MARYAPCEADYRHFTRRGKGKDMSLVDAKKELRQQMQERRAQIPEASRTEQSRMASLLAEKEILTPLRQKRGGRLTLFCYVSFRDEPDTRLLIRSCLNHGDRLLVPKISANRSLSLYEIAGEADLTPGTWGILEPKDSAKLFPPSQYAQIDVVVVPGLAYDTSGGRIGFGAGYYDRFVSELNAQSGGSSRTLFAGLALREQVISQAIPMERHDIRLNVLFTADGMIFMNESSVKLK
ncbi:5-formyltetrahydrofolate cyclo-ligase [Paenibacillus puldeungensis]|uniref:5-formyltetrahydrofolate cyclo-ligase n=1 Tax=Paenibacillus puldeungensis TaxID=696536 RepID=A0ABW3RS74_9BACL